jgi:hypothetical protein
VDDPEKCKLPFPKRSGTGKNRGRALSKSCFAS